MTAAEFDRQFSRLAAHFYLPQDETRETLAVDWLKALQHYHVDAFEHAVTELTRTSEDRFWPALGKVIGLIKARLGRYDKAPGKCATCHGSTWIETQPWIAHGIIYEGLQRCPDCGVPAPQGHERRVMQPLTSVQFHEYRAGRYGRELMPAGSEAKHPERVANPEFAKWAEDLRKRLFGASVEDRGVA